MMGLKRGAVLLCEHDTAWKIEAQHTMERLWMIAGDAIRDIQHVGSTSIRSIRAKPIIDLAVAVDAFDAFLAHEAALRAAGFYDRSNAAQPSLQNQRLFACGSYYDGTGDLQTHFIHVVLAGSREWHDYICFRDYLNAAPSAAKAYESLKLSLAERVPADGGREAYRRGKHDWIQNTLRTARVKVYLGKTVTISIDRPLGSAHPKHTELIYPVNYGFLPGVPGGDGEALDVYLLGVDVPVRAYTAQIVGIVHRHNDVEDKLVAAPVGMHVSAEAIADAVRFQEQYFDSTIEIWNEGESLWTDI